jgi:TolA-binding protein
MKIQVCRCTFFLLSLLLSSSVAANEGLNLDLAILKINKEVKTLNSEILALKDEIEILRENQRLNSEKITELLQMIEINQSSNKKTFQSTSTTQNTKPAKFFGDGKNAFVLGDYKKSIEFFLAHLETSPSTLSKTDTLLWLGRAYFYSGSFLNSKDSYLEYQSMGQDHPKFADSLYELSRALIELDENVQAKLLLDKMLSEYPGHTLSSKASALIQNL